MKMLRIRTGVVYSRAEASSRRWDVRKDQRTLGKLVHMDKEHLRLCNYWSKGPKEDNLDKKGRKEMDPWHPGRILREKWAYRESEETDFSAENWGGKIHFLLVFWIKAWEWNLPRQSEGVGVTPEVSREKCISGMEQWMLCTTIAGKWLQSKRLLWPLERERGQMPF